MRLSVTRQSVVLLEHDPHDVADRSTLIPGEACGLGAEVERLSETGEAAGRASSAADDAEAAADDLEVLLGKLRKGARS